MNSFVHLHLHTQYSFLHGIIKPAPLFRKLKLLGMTACAITDLGNMFGVPDFVIAAQKSGVKPIIGCEMHITNGSRFDHTTKSPDKTRHIVLLAIDDTGHRNLVKLSSLSCLEGYYYVPRIDKELLQQHNEGLICLTGCLNGEIPRLILEGTEKQVHSAVREYFGIFGDRLYFELQPADSSEQKKMNEELISLSNTYSIPLVATGNAHHLGKQDSDACRALLVVEADTLISSSALGRLTNDDIIMEQASHIAGKLYNKNAVLDKRISHLRTPREMISLFSQCPAAIHNTVKIAEMCNVTASIIKGPNLYLARKDTDNNVAFVPADGTHDLSPALKERYTQNDITEIVQFEPIKPRKAIEIAARATGMKPKDRKSTMKLIPPRAKTIREALREVPELGTLYRECSATRRIIRLARKLDGLPVGPHGGTDKGGFFILSKRDLSEWMPLCRGSHDQPMTQYSWDALNRLGAIIA